jgi:TRAP-type mannitol/chloroaromatic compound transport system permease large subunit
MKSVAPRTISMGQVYRAAMPYAVFGLLMLVVVIFVPRLATWLPAVLLGK